MFIFPVTSQSRIQDTWHVAVIKCGCRRVGVACGTWGRRGVSGKGRGGRLMGGPTRLWCFNVSGPRKTQRQRQNKRHDIHIYIYLRFVPTHVSFVHWLLFKWPLFSFIMRLEIDGHGNFFTRPLINTMHSHTSFISWWINFHLSAVMIRGGLFVFNSACWFMRFPILFFVPRTMTHTSPTLSIM